MKFDRHYYTASRSRGGFYTLSHTPQLSTEFIQTTLVRKGLINYSKPIKMDEPTDWSELSHYPIALRFFVDDNKRIFSKIYYTGRANHTPNRFGNFFANTLIAASDLNDVHINNIVPFNIFKNDKIEWKKQLTFEEDATFPDIIPELEISFTKDNQRLTIEKIVNFFSVENSEHLLLTLSVLLDIIIQETLFRPRKKIVIFGKEQELVDWMLILTTLFPSKIINALTFTTYIDNPDLSPFFINGIIPECNISPAALASKEDRYKVIELPFKADKVIAVNAYVETICNLIKHKKTELIVDLLNEDYSLFHATQLDTSINRVAKFHAIIAKLFIYSARIDFHSLLNEFNTLKSDLEKEGIDIAVKKEVLFEKTAETHPVSLDSYYKGKIIWTSVQSICDSAFELYRNGYLHYLNNPSKSEQATNHIDFPNQFLNYVIEQAERRSKAGDNHNLENLSWELLQKFDQYINRFPQDLLRKICVIAVNLLDYDKECQYSRDQIFNRIHKLNDLYNLQLENEFAFAAYQLNSRIADPSTDYGEEYWIHVKDFCLKFKSIITEKINLLTRLLCPPFKKKLKNNDSYTVICFLHKTLEFNESQAIKIYLSINDEFSTLPELNVSFRKLIIYYACLRGQKIGDKEIDVNQIFASILKNSAMQKTIDLPKFKEMLEDYEEFWLMPITTTIFSS